MKKVPIGSLVKIKINFQFSRENKIVPGDYAIVTGYPSEESTQPFDYIVDCKGITVFLFKHELQLVN